MFGDISAISDNLLMVTGKIPRSILIEPDVANALLYRGKETLYIIDTGTTDLFRKKIVEAAEKLRPFKKLVLLNSHSHPDHTANNSVISEIDAADKKHFISDRGIPALNYRDTFLAGYKNMNTYYHFLDAARPPLSGIMAIYKLLGRINPDIPYSLLDQTLAKFRPLEPSIETARAFEKLKPAAKVPVKSARWTGWDFSGEVFVMEARGHSPDSMVFFLPKEKTVFMCDETFDLFPIWPDSNSRNHIESIKRCLLMAQSGEAKTFIDGHHHEVITGEAIVALLNGILENHERFSKEVQGIVRRHTGGLTVHEIYREIRKKRKQPGIAMYCKMEFPLMPVYLKTVIVAMLIEAGAKTAGPAGKKRFSLTR